MNRSLLFSILIVVLLISNLLLALKIFGGPRHGGPRDEGPRNEIIERLDFSKDQIQSYDALIKEHRSEVQELEGQLQEQKKRWLNNLKKADPLPIEGALDSVLAVQRKIEILHFEHFAQIRKICTSDQIHSFDLLVDDLSKLFNKKPKRKKP